MCVVVLEVDNRAWCRKNGQFSETIAWPVRGKFGSVACHGCSDLSKMAVFPFRDQNMAAMAAMATTDFDNPRSKKYRSTSYYVLVQVQYSSMSYSNL
jgi:hypothetical protein